MAAAAQQLTKETKIRKVEKKNRKSVQMIAREISDRFAVLMAKPTTIFAYWSKKNALKGLKLLKRMTELVKVNNLKLNFVRCAWRDHRYFYLL